MWRERSVSYTLLRDRYEWRWRPMGVMENCWRGSRLHVSYVYMYMHIRVEIQRSKCRTRFSFVPRCRPWVRNHARPWRVSRSTNNGPWTREARRARVNYSARVITVANKSFITLLLRAWIWGGDSPRNEINLSRSIARLRGAMRERLVEITFVFLLWRRKKEIICCGIKKSLIRLCYSLGLPARSWDIEVAVILSCDRRELLIGV